MKQVRVVGPKDYLPNSIPKYDENGNFIVNTTSRGEFKDLSPFYLGPVKLYNGYISLNMENAWQYSKVYSRYYKNDKILKEYFEWANVGWSKKRAVRYPMERGAKPLFSYWNGLQLNYIQARKIIYAPLYASLVEKTEIFIRIKHYYNNGNGLALWDFDGYDYIFLDMSLNDVINCHTRKMGHAFVIAMLLQNETVWKD